MEAFLLNKLEKTMLAKKILSFAVLIAAIVTNAQYLTLKGKVTNTQNIPLEYATVSIQEPETFNEVMEVVKVFKLPKTKI